jgi:hypothetical protein
LPQGAPASQLSSEPHSFSRLFTGAFFEALGSLLAAVAGNPSTPSEEELASVSNDLAGILVAAIKAAPVVSNWYAQVAAAMVQAAGAVSNQYPPILKGVFVRRSILSLQSASSLTAFGPSIAAFAARSPKEELGVLARAALPAAQYGLDMPLIVETPSHPRAFLATAAAADATPIEPANAVTAARAFVDDLFRRGRVDYGKVGRPEARIEHGRRLRSHRLVEEAAGISLERVLFDCSGPETHHA